MKVAQIRKAIEGLPDDAETKLLSVFGLDSEGSALVTLAHAESSDGRLLLTLNVEVFSDDFDMEDDDE